MDKVEVKQELTPAERAYENIKKASRDYYRRQNPTPKKRGRPPKLSWEISTVPVENEFK